MKVGELIAELVKLDPELLVVLSEDEEGNGFSPLVEVSGPGWFLRADGDYFDEDDPETPGCECGDYNCRCSQRAVCLWP